MTPLNFQQGFVQPPVDQNQAKRITVYCCREQEGNCYLASCDTSNIYMKGSPWPVYTTGTDKIGFLYLLIMYTDRRDSLTLSYQSVTSFALTTQGRCSGFLYFIRYLFIDVMYSTSQSQLTVVVRRRVHVYFPRLLSPGMLRATPVKILQTYSEIRGSDSKVSASFSAQDTVQHVREFWESALTSFETPYFWIMFNYYKLMIFC